jgi:alkylation response protein AidB-like acyl-CoA dehydrogenase
MVGPAFQPSNLPTFHFDSYEEVTPMDLELNEEQEMIRDAARDFAQNEIAKVAAHYDETGEFPYETINKMGQLGFMGIEVPEEYGGAGMDTLSYVLALEEINKVDAAHGIIMSVNSSLFCYGILKFGTEEQKRKFVTPVMRAITSSTAPRAGSPVVLPPITSSSSS